MRILERTWLGWLVLLALLPCSSASGEEKSAPDLILIYNASPIPLKYGSSTSRSKPTLEHVLPADRFHVYRKTKQLWVSFGSPKRNMSFQSGILYEFHREKDGRHRVQEIVIRPEAKPSSEMVARLEEVRGREAQLQKQLEVSRQQLEESRQESARLQGVVEELERKSKLANSARGFETTAIPFGEVSQHLTGKSGIVVVSWPSCSVYLISRDSEEHWSLVRAGATPLHIRVPAGEYRVMLAAPDEKPCQWIGPQGRNQSLGFGPTIRAGLFVNLEVEEGKSTLVRGLCVHGQKESFEQIVKLVKGSPPLYPKFPFEECEQLCFKTFGRVGVVLEDSEAKNLSMVLSRVGYVRWPFGEGESIELLYRENQTPKFAFRIIQPDVSGKWTSLK